MLLTYATVTLLYDYTRRDPRSELCRLEGLLARTQVALHGGSLKGIWSPYHFCHPDRAEEEEQLQVQLRDLLGPRFVQTASATWAVP